MKITTAQLRQIIREEIRKVSLNEALKWPGKNSLTDKAADDIEKALQRVFDGEGSTGIIANTGGVNFRVRPGNAYSIHTMRSTKKEGAYDVFLRKGSLNPMSSTLKTVDTPDEAIKAAVEIAKKWKTQLTDVKDKGR